MPSRRLRDKLATGKTAFGVWVGMCEPAVIEIVAAAGYDYLSIDMEHSPLNTETVISLLRTATACDISALVRIPAGDHGMLQRVVDMGPDGIYVPHIHSLKEAEEAVQAAKYAPMGARGASLYSRVAEYGVAPEKDRNYKDRVNQEMLLWLQIEEKTAVEDIERIAATPGVDICGLAPHDLSRSLGCKGDRNDPVLMAAAQRVAKAVKANKGVYLAAPATVFGVDGAIALGAGLCNVTDAAGALMVGLRQALPKADK